MSGQSFAAALEDNGFILAKASKGDAQTAQVLAGLNSHIKDAPDWQTRAAIKEGDYLVIDERGHAHRLTERTTGADPSEIPGKLANLAATPFAGRAGRQGDHARREAADGDRKAHGAGTAAAATRATNAPRSAYAVPAPHPSWQARTVEASATG